MCQIIHCLTKKNAIMDSSNKKRALIGLIFIALGAALLVSLFNISIFGFFLPRIVFSWPLILILLGIIFMVNDKNRSTGVILFAIGTFFLVRNHFDLDWVFMMKILIPAVLVLIGITMLFPRAHRRRSPVMGSAEDRSNQVDDVNIFSGGNKNITSDTFQGGQVTCVFGGSELNFRQSTLAPGENILDVTCIFGGCTLFVPEDWTIKVEATAIFGGFSDERSKRNPHLVSDPTKVLTIRGFVLFGGGEIKLA